MIRAVIIAAVAAALVAKCVLGCPWIAALAAANLILGIVCVATAICVEFHPPHTRRKS